MRITERELRSMIREVIKESSEYAPHHGQVVRYRRSDFPDGRFDFIDNTKLDALKQALNIYEKQYLLGKKGDDRLWYFLRGMCKHPTAIKKRFGIF